MTRKLFGTDGVRGQVNIYPMTPEIAMRLGLAAGKVFLERSKRKKVVIGKDTRLSGYIFENALTSGFCASGMDVELVGPIPTPAISFLTQNMRAAVGVVISASHNPFMDNGIKLFDSRGFKLDDEIEDEISNLVTNMDSQWTFPAPEDVGRAHRITDARGRYIVSLKNTIPPQCTLDGMKIVLDCANGAAYRVAPMVFEELGATVIKIGVEPDGKNINYRCGSMYPQVVREAVLEHGADIGIALDGDADRLIVVDEKGRIIDGDQIMALCAADLMERGGLPGNRLVATVMSNMALEIFMRERGGELIRTAVGDRFVAEAMRSRGAVLGGEQSGHIIFINFSTTGDGILAALQLLRIMRDKEKALSDLSNLLEPLPQQLVNVHVGRKLPFDEIAEVRSAVKGAEDKLAGRGRVLLRYSGTEPVARVMVEGEDGDLVGTIAQELAQLLEHELR